MTLDEAGRLQEKWKATHGDQPCFHNRVVDSLTTSDGQKTEQFVCRECGTIYSGPLQSQSAISPQL